MKRKTFEAKSSTGWKLSQEQH